MSAPLPIAETFVSIQGEGKLAGTPSWFVRFSGCNLRCAWCDTPYASWKPEKTTRTLDDLVAEARAGGVRHAVVTGGEPMIFDAVVPLTRALHDAGLHITIETAGTVDRAAEALHCDLLSLSPKLANSTPTPEQALALAGPSGAPWPQRHERLRTNLPALQSLLDRHPSRQFKFVVRSDADLPEIHALLGQLRGWSAGDIMLMLEGVTPPSPQSRAWVISTCERLGWRHSPRLHIERFGNRRGT